MSRGPQISVLLMSDERVTSEQHENYKLHRAYSKLSITECAVSLTIVSLLLFHCGHGQLMLVLVYCVLFYFMLCSFAVYVRLVPNLLKLR